MQQAIASGHSFLCCAPLPLPLRPLVVFSIMASLKKEETKEKRERCLAAAASRRASGDDVSAVAVQEKEEEDDEEEVQVVQVTEAPAAKKPRLVWKCSRCTYDNVSSATVCAACETVKPGLTTTTTNQQWTCSICTFLNKKAQMICEICGMKSKAACASVVPPKATGPPPPLSSQITIVTFNVSGFQKSYSAPAGFDPMESFSEELLRDDPNVICLQEATERGDTFYDTLLPGYICLGKAASHCGLAMLFVKFGWAGHATPIHTHAPAILARIKFAGGESVVFGSCHLEPYGSGAQERLRQMKEVLRHCGADD